ncbi:MAG TPA: hypothetical protein PKV75_06115 [Desulfobacterales bacterium]|nr:hypothetical protein [Desulfobacterales bacterium]
MESAPMCIIDYIRHRYGFFAIPAKIYGNRWSFEGEKIDTEMAFGISGRIQLTDKKGIIVYSNDPVPDEAVKDILQYFQETGK